MSTTISTHSEALRAFLCRKANPPPWHQRGIRVMDTDSGNQMRLARVSGLTAYNSAVSRVMVPARHSRCSSASMDSMP